MLGPVGRPAEHVQVDVRGLLACSGSVVGETAEAGRPARRPELTVDLGQSREHRGQLIGGQVAETHDVAQRQDEHLRVDDPMMRSDHPDPVATPPLLLAEDTGAAAVALGVVVVWLVRG